MPNMIKFDCKIRQLATLATSECEEMKCPNINFYTSTDATDAPDKRIGGKRTLALCVNASARFT